MTRRHDGADSGPDDYIVIADDHDAGPAADRPEAAVPSDAWKVIIADDAAEIHQVTRLALKDFTFEGAPLAFYSARSFAETRTLVDAHPDAAVILLDVVMEEKDSGLSAVKYIRETAGNRRIRIILRTAHPGEAPEALAVSEYDINDYKLKTELTWNKLYTAMLSALRSFRDITTIDANRREIADLYQRLNKHSRRLRELENIINRCPVVVFLRRNEPGYPFEYVSESVSLFGFRAGDFVSGRISMRHCIHPEDLPRVIREVKECTSAGREEFSQEYRILTPAGDIRWADVRTFVRRNEQGEISHYQGIMIDVTLNKEIEKARLEKRVAETSARQKGEFLANMSHEIRTPMNAIVGLTDLVLKTELTAKQEDYFRKIRSASRSLIRIINDVLDFSKIDAGQMILEAAPFDLQEVMDNLSGLFSDKADEKGLEFVLSVAHNTPCALIGDPYRLGQVLTNLINNAVKFTDRGEVVVKAEPAGASNDRAFIRFSVHDTGIGIPAAQVSRLFTAFTQADASTTRRFGGTGLGLAISKRLAEMMGGDIRAESRPGGGSVFYFTAGFGVQENARAGRFVIPEALRSGRVLVADDNESSREILRAFLNSFSLDVVCVPSGRAALAELRRAGAENPFRLVLMDWKMPDMDGVETTKRIREELCLSRLPTVIMVTGYGREEVRRQARMANVDGFLFKPVKRALLYDTIMEAFGAETARAAADDAPGPPCGAEAGIRLKRVLVAEDNKTNRLVVTDLLENAGAVVVNAENGHEAISAVGRFDFDAVLMDVEMPGMDGYEATRRIRRDGGYPDLPIIAMTAHAMDDVRRRCLESGMNDYLAKPVGADALYAMLARWTSPAFGDRVPAAPEPETPLPDDLPWLNIPEALARFKGRKSLLRRLLLDFPEDYGDAARRMRQALDAGDRATARRIAHTMKGVSANIGAAALRACAGELESALHEDNGTSPETLLDQFESDLEKVVASARRVEPREDEEKEAANGGGETDSSKAGPLIRELYYLLREKDLSAEDCFMKLEKHLGGPEFAQRRRLLGERIGRLDFSGALAVVSDVAGALHVNLGG